MQDWEQELDKDLRQWQAEHKRPAPEPAAKANGGASVPVRKKSKLVDAGEVDESSIRAAWEKNTLAKVRVITFVHLDD